MVRLANSGTRQDRHALLLRGRRGENPMDKRELVIVGGGPAGLSAAVAAHEAGVRDILLLERDQYLGGILNQCIHPGFGLHRYQADLTGPEYAGRLIREVERRPEIKISLRSFVIRLASTRELTCIKPGELKTLRAQALIMATGCRERTREMIHIAGTRPAGIYSAGLAQKMINLQGWLPGKEVVVVGSGDIGLIMARRFSLEGAKVKAVLEIQKSSRGLVRNVVQCLEDFEIPLYLRHKVTRILGKDRVAGVRVAEVDDALRPKPGTEFEIACDTVLISAGLIPENELIEMAGIPVHPQTHAPISEELNATSVPGIWVTGNAYRVYDLADEVSRDAAKAGTQAAEYLRSAACKKN